MHALHDHDVEPPAELAADLAFGADDLEAAPPVQRDRRVVPADDPCDHRVVPVLLGEPDELGEQLAADPGAAMVGADVDRVLHGREVRRPLLVGRERSEPDDLADLVDRHDRRVPAAVLLDPRDLVLEAPRHEVEGDGRAGDLGVVDGPDRAGVGAVGGTEGGGHGSGRYRTRSWLLVFPGSCRDHGPGGRRAPLAQLAEHFHGKEGVYGSSP